MTRLGIAGLIPAFMAFVATPDWNATKDQLQVDSPSGAHEEAGRACGEYLAWADWLDGDLILEKRLCPESGKTLVWGRIHNVSSRTIRVRVYAYTSDERPARCGDGSPSLSLAGTLTPGDKRADWTYLDRGESLTPCALLDR
jgi:hypothetical protein